MTADRWFAKNSGKSANFMNFKTTSRQFLFDGKGMITTGSVRWALVMMILGDDWPRSVNDDHLAVIMYTVSWAGKWPKTYNSTAENTQTNTHRYLHIRHTFIQHPRLSAKQKRCLAVNHATHRGDSGRDGAWCTNKTDSNNNSTTKHSWIMHLSTACDLCTCNAGLICDFIKGLNCHGSQLQRWVHWFNQLTKCPWTVLMVHSCAVSNHSPCLAWNTAGFHQ